MRSVSMGSTDADPQHRPVLDSAASPADNPLFDLLPVATAVLAPDGIVLRVNPAFEQQFDYKANQLLGRSWLEFVHAEDRSILLQTLFADGALDGHGDTTRFRLEHRFNVRSGHPQQIACTAAADLPGRRWVVSFRKDARPWSRSRYRSCRFSRPC